MYKYDMHMTIYYIHTNKVVVVVDAAVVNVTDIENYWSLKR